MSGLNTEWAPAELNKFIDLIMTINSGNRNGVRFITTSSGTAARDAEVPRQAQVVENVFDRGLMDWRKRIEQSNKNSRTHHREARIRAKEEVLRDAEVRLNLGEDAPEICAANRHPRVWSGGASPWLSGHDRSAVEDAAKKVNSETQSSGDRNNVGETKPFQESFGAGGPAVGKPLPRMANDSSDIDTFKLVQRWAVTRAEGVYAGIRNPTSREDPMVIDKQVALEYLAALSVVVRWVDESTVEVLG